MSLTLTTVLFDCLRRAGYHVGTATLVRVGECRELVAHVDATCTKTGEQWIVNAPTEYEAVIEILRGVGFELEDE